jgi:hypothetical protein
MTAAVEVPMCVRVGCARPLRRRTGEALPEFRNRRYCSQGCYNQRRIPVGQEQRHARQLLSRDCAACGARLVRKDGEAPVDWKRRKFCGKTCSLTATRVVRAVKAPLVDGELDWQSNSKCRGTEHIAWWARDSGWEEEERLRELAVRYCRPCPVRAACRLRSEIEPDGVWGGVVVRHVGGRPHRLDLLDPVESVRAS